MIRHVAFQLDHSLETLGAELAFEASFVVAVVLQYVIAQQTFVAERRMAVEAAL